MTRSNRRPRSGGAKPRPRTPAPKAGAPHGLPHGLRIGEAARIVGVATYVLRFWETQFSFLKPRHAQSSHRLYLERDLELLKLVKRLLHKERFTIEGAKKHLREVGLEAALAGAPTAPPPMRASRALDGARNAVAGDPSMREALSFARRELQSIHRLLES